MEELPERAKGGAFDRATAPSTDRVRREKRGRFPTGEPWSIHAAPSSRHRTPAAAKQHQLHC